MPDEKGTLGPLKQRRRCAQLHDAPLVHDHNGVGEGQRFGLVMGDVNHRHVERGAEP